MRTIFAAVLLALSIPTSAAAQALWTPPSDARARLSLEALYPIHDNFRFNPLSGAAYLTGTVAIVDRLRLVADLPLTRYDIVEVGPNVSEERTETTVGNPYLGIEVETPLEGFFAEVGTRLPVGDATPGRRADVTGRPASLGRGVIAPQVLLNYRKAASSSLTYRLRIGPQMLFPKPGGYQGDRYESSTLLKYGAQVWYDAGLVMTGAGLTGTLRASGNAQDFTDRVANSFTITALGNFDAVQPGLLLRTSFVYDEVSLVAGLTLSVSLW